tara:strand:+ start:1285 stop:1464 length:180 start_codon:yes stop_codon:yes gene_type:complete
LIYHGGGGFTHHDVYNMPVYLRRFYIEELMRTKKVESDAIEKSTNDSKINKPPNFKIPK